MNFMSYMYICVRISALHEAVGKIRNCGMQNAKGDMRNGTEWNVQNVTAEQMVI